MPDLEDRQKLDSLSETLNRLAKKGLSVTETAEQRAALAAIAAGFNNISTPAADKLLPALSQVADPNSRWFVAKMLRDVAVKDETKAAEIVNALYNDFARTGDAETRRMASGLLSSIAVAHESVAVRVASNISMMLEGEKDTTAKTAEKNALMTLAMKYEMTAPIAVSSIAVAISKEQAPGTRIQLTGDMRDIGKKYASQASSVIRQLGKTGLREKDGLASQHIAQNIVDVAQVNPFATPLALEALSTGFTAASDTTSISGYSRALSAVGLNHPAAALSTMANLLEAGLDKQHRQMIYLSLGDIAQLGSVPSLGSVSVLSGALSKENDASNRRLIINGLVVGAINGNDEGEKVKDVLKRHLATEKDASVYNLVERSLGTLGFVRQHTPNVLNFQPMGGR